MIEPIIFNDIQNKFFFLFENILCWIHFLESFYFWLLWNKNNTVGKREEKCTVLRPSFITYWVFVQISKQNDKYLFHTRWFYDSDFMVIMSILSEIIRVFVFISLILYAAMKWKLTNNCYKIFCKQWWQVQGK